MDQNIKNHPEWEQENSLTAPEDRDRENKWRPEQGAPSLSEDEVVAAMKSLNNSKFTEKFPKVDRTYADPPPSLQNIGLISFTPAKGAKPNENGVYGFAKLRGNYASETEADQRAEWLIRNVDSYHQIYHTYVGRPFPITASSDYSAETTEIDIRKQMTESISENVKQKEDKTEDPYETYTTLRVKKAQLAWTYLEHYNKMKEIKEIILKTRESINDMENESTEYKQKYFEKYMNARKEAGFKDSKEEFENSFMKFLVEDEILPGIDETLLVEV
jgi:hypothetical protein